MESISNYKCISCGASLRFEPTNQNWKCDYCLSTFTKQDLDKHYVEKQTREQARQEQRQAELGTAAKTKEPKQVMELDSYHCKNCGAEIVGDKQTLATFCLYCKSPAVIKGRMQGEFNPRYVIPFKITQEQAVSLYGHWIKKHFLAPKEFKEDEEIEKIRGVYAPFWLYHAKDLDIDVRGTGENDRVWRSGNTEYTETSYYEVQRKGTIAYNNIPVDASTNMEDEGMLAIEPFNYADMIDFSPDYMSGFFAERYDQTKDDLENIAKNRMSTFAIERMRQTIHYDRFRADVENVEFHQIDADYGLLPVYILTNIYQGKTLQYIVNGQTGKIYGEVPISKMKLGLVSLITFLAVWFGMALFSGIFG